MPSNLKTKFKVETTDGHVHVIHAWSNEDAIAEARRRGLTPVQSTDASHQGGSAASKLHDMAFGPVSSHNRIYRANLTGGFSGWLGDSSRRALRHAVQEANGQGYEVVVVVPDTINLLQRILYSAILLVTLFIWCPEPGYLVVCKRQSGATSSSPTTT